MRYGCSPGAAPASKNQTWLLFMLLKWLICGSQPPINTPEPGPEPIIPCCDGFLYKVQSGDTLWNIGQRYGFTVEQLMNVNPHINDPDLIFEGQFLCIPENKERVSLSYLFGTTSYRYLELLSKTQNSLNTVCPDFMELDFGGNLVLAGANKLNRPFLDVLHGQGLKIIPFLANHWNREIGIAALQNRDRLSGQIAEAVETYGFDGVDVDIENVTHEHRDMYTDFMRLLREKIPIDKLVTTAVAANPRGFTTGWHGSYDYKRLADYCDYLMIMNYDEHFYGSAPGPVSSAGFFKGSIRFALEQGVPKEKIVSGVPFYGRAWKRGDVISGIGLANRDVEYLLAHYESTSSFDTTAQSARATVTINPGELEPDIWGGRKLTAGIYDIWYDSPKATRYKLDVIRQYDLRGAGSWALGQEILTVWDFWKSALV